MIIEYLGRESRFSKNIHHLRCEPGVQDKELMKWLEEKQIDHNSFGYKVDRVNGTHLGSPAVIATICVYTD
jgi:hypothetical protein